jgi:sulfite exporter TauE/SafE
MPLGLYGALLVSGLLGSLGHCVGMCGSLVMLTAMRSGTGRPRALPAQAAYHLARIGSYALLGMLVGAVGSLAGLGGSLSDLAGLVSVTLGLGMVLFAFGFLGWLPPTPATGAGVWLTRSMGRALRLGGMRGMVLLGALNGLLPCGLVYSALLASASLGGELSAAAGMIVFGLATTPALLIVGAGAGALGGAVRQGLARLAGILMIGVGVQQVLRGLAALSLAPHVQLGGAMLW